jgi:hypothetical protein
MSGFGTPEIASSVSVWGGCLGLFFSFLVLAVREGVPLTFLVSFPCSPFLFERVVA